MQSIIREYLGTPREARWRDLNRAGTSTGSKTFVFGQSEQSPTRGLINNKMNSVAYGHPPVKSSGPEPSMYDLSVERPCISSSI
jgi:hypothetical protein